jgi:transcriptional regulator with XRE-family HTH domain
MTIRQYLDHHQLTITEFARRLKVSRAEVYKWLNGRFPQGKSIAKLVKVTDGQITADDIFKASKRKQKTRAA